jgi:hypothetical protein
MNNYLDKLKSIDDKAIKAQLKVIMYQIKILGTNITIEKFDQQDENRSAFGGMFQTDDFIKSKRNYSTSRIVVNRNYLNDHYTKQSLPLIVYHIDPILSVGDLITFTQDNIIYRFKVEKKHSYGLSPHVIYKWDLIGLPEDTSNSSGAGDSC